MQSVRIYEMPDCQMVSSGIGMFGDERMEAFGSWMASQPASLFPRDFLFWDKTGFHWLYLYQDGMAIPEGFDLIDFRGGLYAVATGIDQQTDRKAMEREIDGFLQENGFQRDPSRPELGNIITSPRAKAVMGYEQMDYYTPIKGRE